MPHFTVVPVDGPRRGDYDNLEGLSWVDYGERAEREDSDGEGALCRDSGLDGGRLHGTRAAKPRAHRSMRDSTFLAPSLLRPKSLFSPGLPGLVVLHPPTPSSSPEGRGRGLQTWLPGEAGQRAPSFWLVPNALSGSGPGSTEAWIVASSLFGNRPHLLESRSLFPSDSPPLFYPLSTPCLLVHWPGRSEGCAF